MTEKDKELIKEAEGTISEFMYKLIEQAESEEAKEILREMDKRKYYRERFKTER